jgi:hypothetical protein
MQSVEFLGAVNQRELSVSQNQHSEKQPKLRILTEVGIEIDLILLA